MDFGDWSVHYRMLTAGSAYMDVSLVCGDPYSWFEFNGMTPTLTPGGAVTAYDANGNVLGTTFTTDHFPHRRRRADGCVRPHRDDVRLRQRHVHGDFQRLRPVPRGGRSARCDHGHARTVLPARLRHSADRRHDASDHLQLDLYAPLGQVATTWNINTVALRAGADLSTLQGWLPHDYEDIVSGPSLLTGYSYPTIDGLIKLSLGQSFTIVQPSVGLTAMLAVPGQIGGTADYNPAQMSYYLSTYLTQHTTPTIQYGDDTYWGGKDLQMFAEYALMSSQLGDPTAAAYENALQVAMTDWFTYTPGETAHYFAYYNDAKALIGFDSAYGAEEFTDNHFHYGYFTTAAGVLGMLDPAWLSEYGAMAEMVAKEYANWDRTDTRFPFLRTFEPGLVTATPAAQATAAATTRS